MPVKGRDLSSRQTQYVVKDMEIGQPINSKQCSETADGVARESKGVESCPREAMGRAAEVVAPSSSIRTDGDCPVELLGEYGRLVYWHGRYRGGQWERAIVDVAIVRPLSSFNRPDRGVVPRVARRLDRRPRRARMMARGGSPFPPRRAFDKLSPRKEDCRGLFRPRRNRGGAYPMWCGSSARRAATSEW